MIDFFTSTIKTLRDTFGEDYKIFTHNLSSGFQMPAFAVSPVLSNEKLFFNNRYISENKISIRFYCKNEDKSRLYTEVCSKITENFETLIINDEFYRSSNISFDEKQDYLEIKISYDYFFYKTEIKEKMQYLKIYER